MGKLSIVLLDKNSKRYLSSRKQEWTLCLGAGINSGILPDWSILTTNVVNRCFKHSWTKDDLIKKNQEIGFTYDSWIQASLNKHIKDGGNLVSFNKIIEEELYGDLIKLAAKEKLGIPLINFLNNPRYNRKSIIRVVKFFEDGFRNSTLMQLVRCLSMKSDQYALPSAIISLNADTLLYSLLIGYNIVYSKYKYKTLPPEPFKLILKSYHMWGDKIPLFHLHGSIIPEAQHKTVKKGCHDSKENLIFLEGSYSKVAGAMYSWAQTNFLYYASNSHMIFLGLSMSDPNIRRWLNWSSDYLRNDLSPNLDSDSSVCKHLWIKKDPIDKELNSFYQNSLLHLGVKVAWIKGYNEIESGLKNIMIK